MLKICAIVGSNSSKSNTKYYVEKFLKCLKQKVNVDVNLKIFHLSDFKIKYCIGCLACNRTGKCSLIDDMDFLKSQMIKCDIVIWASPIYLNNVSGIMKAFIDRLSTWSHTMRLIGKKGIILTTTSHGGDIQVRDYLKSVLWSMGVMIIGDFNMCVDYPKELYSENKEDNIIKKSVLDTIQKNKKNDSAPSLVHEVIFSGLKKRITTAIENNYFDNYEVRFWTNNNFIKYNSFCDLLKDINKIKKLSNSDL